MGNWDFGRRKKGTVKQQLWSFLSIFDVLFIFYFFISVFKINSLTDAYSNFVVLIKKEHLDNYFQVNRILSAMHKLILVLVNSSK